MAEVGLLPFARVALHVATQVLPPYRTRNELREHIAVLQPLAVLGEGGRVPDRIVRRQSRRTSDTKDCSPVAPSTGVPSGCRRTPAAATRSAIAPEGSKDVPSLAVQPTKAAVQITTKHPGQVPGPSAADGSLAHAYPARCTKQAALIRKPAAHDHLRRSR